LISDHADRTKKPAAQDFYGILTSSVIALRQENVWMSFRPSPEWSHIALDYKPYRSKRGCVTKYWLSSAHIRATLWDSSSGASSCNQGVEPVVAKHSHPRFAMTALEENQYAW